MEGLFIPEITTEMFRNGCLESIETLMAEGEIYDIEYSPWIPVSERLPEIEEKDCHGNITFSKTVLTSQKYGNGFIHIGKDQYTTNNGGGWLSEVPFDDPDECCEVIAWMPLPKPYTAESEARNDT